jgi:hypothetical protein
MMVGEKLTRKDMEGSGYGLISRYYPGTHLEGLRKSRNSWSQGRDLNPRPPEYKGVTIRL